MVIGMASTAPAYSLAATLGFVVIAVGVKAPAIMLLAFIPMYFIAVAYSELNKREPDCGTTFTWAARAFGPRTGWMGGWGIIAADVIVMANLAQIAGVLRVPAVRARQPGRAARSGRRSPASCWIVVMTYICYRGIEVSARIQYVLLSDRGRRPRRLRGLRAGEGLRRHRAGRVAAPVAVLAVALGPELVGADRRRCCWRSSSTGAGTPRSRSTRRRRTRQKTPGRAAIISTLLLLATYAIVSIATVAFAGVGTTGIGLGNEDNADGRVQRHRAEPCSAQRRRQGLRQALLIISVLTSASASTQTTILPTARAALSMGAYRAIRGRSRGSTRGT